MARNGSGAMSVINSIGAGTEILSTPHNQNYADIAAEITNSLALDGQSTMTGQSKAANGTVGAPSMTFGGDLDTGRYHKAADTMADVCGGAEVQVISPTGVDVTGTHSASGLSSGLGHVPIGTVVDYAGLTEPTGWLFLNGGTFLRTLPLFAVIGTQYGTGNGTTTATLPDCAGRVVAGKESAATRLTSAGSGVDGGTLGAVGGAQTVTLDTTMIPSHNHSVTDSHTHTYRRFTPGEDFNYLNFAAGGGGGTVFSNNTDQDSAQSTTPTSAGSIAINNTGGGTAHNNAQPTIVLNKIIFAGV